MDGISLAQKLAASDRSRTKRGRSPLLAAAVPALYRERRPATARALRVGVLDDELGAFQTFLVIDFGAGEVLVAHRIDEQGYAVLLHHGIVFVLHFVEGEAVLEARAAAAGHEHAQLEFGVALFVDQLLHLVGCAIAERQRR